MKIGDRLRCTRSLVPSHYTVGYLYTITGFDSDGDPVMETNDGNNDHVGCPLNGVIWDFEPVDEQAQTEALVKLLEMSQADVEAGRVMTREQVLERLEKDRN